MINLGKAKNLSELEDKVKEAIHKFGPEAKWWGWDDGSIIIDSVEEQAYIESGVYE